MIEKEIDPHGAKSLFVAIIEQAICDLKRFQAKKIIVGVVVDPNAKQTKRVQATELLYFFRKDGPMDKFISGLCLDISGDVIREKLSLV